MADYKTVTPPTTAGGSQVAERGGETLVKKNANGLIRANGFEAGCAMRGDFMPFWRVFQTTTDADITIDASKFVNSIISVSGLSAGRAWTTPTAQNVQAQWGTSGAPYAITNRFGTTPVAASPATAAVAGTGFTGFYFGICNANSGQTVTLTADATFALIGVATVATNTCGLWFCYWTAKDAITAIRLTV